VPLEFREQPTAEEALAAVPGGGPRLARTVDTGAPVFDLAAMRDDLEAARRR
jgi:hypothetical protein